MWTAPRTWVVGELVTAAIMNTHVRDNLLARQYLWVPVTAAYSDGAWASLKAYGNHAIGDLNAANDRALCEFRCPPDFAAITSAVIVVISRVTDAAANWDIYAYMAAAGQAYNTHTASDLATTYNVVADRIEEVDVSGILAAMAAGDYVGVQLLLGDAADDCDVLGFWMVYS